MNNENNIEQEFVSYEKEKIQYVLTIINAMGFTGIQQAQYVTQIYTILNNPTKVEKNGETR